MNNKIIENILKDIKSIPERITKPFYKNGKFNTKKFMVDIFPYLLVAYIVNKYMQACLLSGQKGLLNSCLSGFDYLGKAFITVPYIFPSLQKLPLFGGVLVGVLFKLYMIDKKNNAKKFRHKEEYGTARFGNDDDIEPFIDNVPEQNILLTKTESLRMTRPSHPKYERNKNIVVVGGSGAGKTRGFVKPNIMQMHSSYVITDPKGTILVETGEMLKRGGFVFNPKTGEKLLNKEGKPIRQPYKIKVFNTINFNKSLHYNPFAYIKTEQDILKFVDVLMTNTKGEGQQSGDDFWVKAERLLFCAYIAYIIFYCNEEEQNFISLLTMIDESKTSEEDEDYENAIDELFKDIEFGNEEYGIEADPDSFAVRQYKKYKLAAGKTAKSILISCGARLAPFDIAEIREITRYDELDLLNIGVEKTALFVIISDTDDSLNFLVAILYTQMFNLLCTLADDKYNGRLPIHVRCILDEFANIGKIPKFDKLIATIRSREVSANIILQSDSQLKSIYKENAETILDNCDTYLFLGGKSKTTLKNLSETMGKETIDTIDTSETRGASPSYGLSYRKTGRELMTVDQIAQMDGDDCLLEIRGLPPFKSKKYEIEKHYRYKELSDYDKKNQFDIEKFVQTYNDPKYIKNGTVYEINISKFVQSMLDSGISLTEMIELMMQSDIKDEIIVQALKDAGKDDEEIEEARKQMIAEEVRQAEMDSQKPDNQQEQDAEQEEDTAIEENEIQEEEVQTVSENEENQVVYDLDVDDFISELSKAVGDTSEILEIYEEVQQEKE